MNNQNVCLGDLIFPNILDNALLQAQYENLLFNYATKTLSLNDIQSRPLDICSLLCFADLLSKSTDKSKRNQHLSIAQEIMTLLGEIYPDNPDVKYYIGSVLSAAGNYRGAELKAESFRNLIPEEFYSQNIEKEYLAVPNIKEKYFFPDQKKAFDSLDSDYCSFSAPTSLGKTFVITSFITSKVLGKEVFNYAIVLPTKALISEVSIKLGKLLREYATSKNYRILTSAIPSDLDENCSYIAVMTPEQLHHTICSNNNFCLNWLFIDEAYKITQKNNKRSGYYLDLIDELNFNGNHPHIVFSSPGVPNPEIYLKLTPEEGEKSNLLLNFSPVVQEKFFFDESSGELFIYNNIKKESMLVCKNKTLSFYDFIHLMQEKRKKSIIYCSSKNDVAKSANEFSKSSENKDTAQLNELSEKLKKDIHNDFWLSDTVNKGIGYHMGSLPASIRNAIESSFRDVDNGLDVIFCTSTLLEGVNLPADNIFITSTKNGEEMTSLDFKNLLGRVGRIEYNLHGNVFLVHKKKSHTKISDFVNLLEKPIEMQNFSFVNALDYDTKSKIVNNLKKGEVGLPRLSNEEDSKESLERSLSNKLLKDIVSEKSGVLRDFFGDVLTTEDTNKIEKEFKDFGPTPNDIFISMDQSKNLYNSIMNGLQYPRENATFNELKDFFEKLKDIFVWSNYEPKTLGKGNSVVHYAYIVYKWVNGSDLKDLIVDEIKDTEEFKKKNNNSYKIDDDKPTINNCITKVLNEIDTVIGFKLCRYFQQFSETYQICNKEKPSPDWHEFLEYGTKIPLQIWLCEQGFSRETAKLIYQDENRYIEKSFKKWHLKWNELLKSDDEQIKEEAKRVSLFQSGIQS